MPADRERPEHSDQESFFSGDNKKRNDKERQVNTERLSDDLTYQKIGKIAFEYYSPQYGSSIDLDNDPEAAAALDHFLDNLLTFSNRPDFFNVIGSLHKHLSDTRYDKYKNIIERHFPGFFRLYFRIDDAVQMSEYSGLTHSPDAQEFVANLDRYLHEPWVECILLLALSDEDAGGEFMRKISQYNDQPWLQNVVLHALRNKNNLQIFLDNISQYANQPWALEAARMAFGNTSLEQVLTQNIPQYANQPWAREVIRRVMWRALDIFIGNIPQYANQPWAEELARSACGEVSVAADKFFDILPQIADQPWVEGVAMIAVEKHSSAARHFVENLSSYAEYPFARSIAIRAVALHEEAGEQLLKDIPKYAGASWTWLGDVVMHVYSYRESSIAGIINKLRVHKFDAQVQFLESRYGPILDVARLGELQKGEEDPFIEGSVPATSEEYLEFLTTDAIVGRDRGIGEDERKWLRKGMDYFGAKAMAQYIRTHDRHEALFNIDRMVVIAQELVEKNIMRSPQEFAQKILLQVANDTVTYHGRESSYTYLNAILQIQLDAHSVQGNLGRAREFSEIEELRALLDEIGEQSPFSSWRMLKKYYDLVQLLNKKEILDALKELKKSGNEKLFRYVSSLAFHPNISMERVIMFWRKTGRFLDIDEIHSPESHERKKPLHYTVFEHLDLTPEELRDALIDGRLDDMQVFRPMRVEYQFFDEQGSVRDRVKRALGSRKQGIVGEARDIKGLFHELKKNVFGGDQQKLLAYLEGKEELNPEQEKQVDALVYHEQFGMKRPSASDTYRATLYPKSSPEGVVAGNDTACCMPFGSGKNNVYMFNPDCVMFTVQKKVGDGWRTVAQSVMTADKDIDKNVAEVIRAMEVEGRHKMHEFIDEGMLVQKPLVATADNMEVAPNYKPHPQKEHVLGTVYRHFFKSYLAAMPEEARQQWQNAFMAIGQNYTDRLSVFHERDNTFVPVAPVGYSDNIKQKCYTLDLAVEPDMRGVIARTIEQPTFVSREDRGLPRGVTTLNFQNILEIAYLEGKIYADNENLIQYIHRLENEIIASEINNRAKGRSDLNLVYKDKEGKALGYMIAYEGVSDKEAENPERVIYISDFASESPVAAGRLLQAFEQLVTKHYLKKGDAVPIVAEAREKTSYALIVKQLEKFGQAAGYTFTLEELGSHREGPDVLHRIKLIPHKRENT